MTANELRIGNWIFIGINKEPYQVNARFFSSVANGFSHEEMVKAGYEELNSTVSPIPLTEKWLLKLGLEKQDYKMSGCAVFEIPNSLWRIGQSFKGELCYFLWHKQVSPPTWSLSELKYVHQLQNIIFALTGEELTIKND